MTAIGPQESHHAPIPLQLRNVDVEVHAIDPLDFESHVIFKDVGHRSWYIMVGLWLLSAKRPTDRKAVASQKGPTASTVRIRSQPEPVILNPPTPMPQYTSSV